MTLTINDRGEDTKLIISSGDKTLLKKKGKSIKSLLRFVFDNTKKENVKQSIMNLEKALPLMKKSLTTITIKGD